MPDIIVIGDIDTDIYLEIPHIPTWDEGVLATNVSECAGGKGANTAVVLSALGTSVGIIANAGDDHYGEVAIESLKRYGVDLAGLDIIAGGKTSYCIMMLDATGEKAIVVIATDLIYPQPEDIKRREGILLSGAHVHAIGLQPKKMEAGLLLARQAGITTSVDLDSAYQGLNGSEQTIRNSTIVFLNEQGIASLFPELDIYEALKAMSSMGPKIVVLTRGRKGAVAYDGNRFVEKPAFLVKVKDTTGSGDSFAAAFLHGYLRKWELEKSLEFANATAALSALAIGAQSKAPCENEVFNFIKNH